MATQAIKVQGTTIAISTAEQTDVNVTPAPASAALECLSREITYSPANAAELEATAICSTAKEFLFGLDDPGTLSVNGFWRIGHAGHDAIVAASNDKLSRLITVTFSDTSKFKCIAFVNKPGFSGSVDNVMNATYSFRLTGPVAYVDPV